MLNSTTQFWKDETIKQAKALSKRELLHAFKLRAIEIISQYYKHSSHAPEDTCINDIINEIEEMK